MPKIGCVNAGGHLRKSMTIDFRLSQSEAEAKASATVAELSRLIERAADSGCQMVILPEDCLCTSGWESGNPDRAGTFLETVVSQMLDQLANIAQKRSVSVVCCNDRVDGDGQIRNTAYLIERDGRATGQYDKVCFPIHETWKAAGDHFPVFETADFGNVGILICYDMVFPEAARCIALNGADIIVNPTVGGAAFGGADISKAAFITRAVENFAYIATSWGGWGTDTGSMIFSPKGAMLSETLTPGEIAIADVDPTSGRDHADWSNAQSDMRARLFRERRPSAFGVLTEVDPPASQKLPPAEPGAPEEVAKMIRRATTVGHLEFESAEKLKAEGKTEEAVRAYRDLMTNYPNTWFDRTAMDRLADLNASAETRPRVQD